MAPDHTPGYGTSTMSSDRRLHCLGGQPAPDAIERDLKWLGYDWGMHLYHASDYFDQLYAWAEYLITHGLAYVDDQ